MTPSPEESLDIEALKPCPFCGGEDVAVYETAVRCRDCGGGVALEWEPDAQPSVAIKAWNRRARAKQQEESGELREKIAEIIFDGLLTAVTQDRFAKRDVEQIVAAILALLPPQDERGEGAFDPQVLVPFAEFARAILHDEDRNDSNVIVGKVIRDPAGDWGGRITFGDCRALLDALAALPAPPKGRE